MTTEEKLKHFLDVSIEGATKQGASMLEDYKEALNQIFEQHKKDAVRKADLQVTLGIASLEHEKNKELSKEQIRIKRETSQLQEELKEQLFTEVKNLLEQYMATEEYQNLLIKQMKEAKKFAGKEEMILYIDPVDSANLNNLEAAVGAQISISKFSFMGGTKAVIQSKNILIDNSFETKFNELKEAFTFMNK